MASRYVWRMDSARGRMREASLRCPLCESVIAREVYERVLRIDEARKRDLDKAA